MRITKKHLENKAKIVAKLFNREYGARKTGAFNLCDNQLIEMQNDSGSRNILSTGITMRETNIFLDGMIAAVYTLKQGGFNDIRN